MKQVCSVGKTFLFKCIYLWSSYGAKHSTTTSLCVDVSATQETDVLAGSGCICGEVPARVTGVKPGGGPRGLQESKRR